MFYRQSCRGSSSGRLRLSRVRLYSRLEGIVRAEPDRMRKRVLEIGCESVRHSRIMPQSSKGEVSFPHGLHFFAAAAEAMRRILVALVRRKASHQHGGPHIHLDLEGSGR